MSVVRFHIEGRHGPIYRGRGRMVDPAAYEARRHLPYADQTEVELADVVWDDEPVPGATESISVHWRDDEAWVFPHEVDSDQPGLFGTQP